MIRRQAIRFSAIGFALSLLLCCAIAQADVFHMASGLTSVQFVTVGNPGNAPDTRYNGISVGSVDHVYQMGKYEITAGQYTEFLNAVAQDDPIGLFNYKMSDPYLYNGANIQRSGESPNFSYSVAADWANRPVNYVSFWDAARFANWLQNGQPTGAQGPGTTESGAYHDVGNQSLFGRNVGARFFIPTEDEWYKAAYHKKSAGLAASYFDYPTGSSTAPSNSLPDPGNHASLYNIHGYTIGDPYWRTEVGAFVNSASPYGTFDQGGNIEEWDETVLRGSERGLRGGTFDSTSDWLSASFARINNDPRTEQQGDGFRLAGLAPSLPGDYDGNGYVGAEDYDVWKNTFGSNSMLAADGNGNHIVDAADYTIWRDHLGSGTLPNGAGAAVPEPGSIALCVVGVITLGLWLRIRR